MSSKRKGLRYSQKRLERLDYKREESANLRMKVLRYVMAVGFVLSPWLGGEAYAAGIERIDGVTLPNSDVKQAYFTGNDGNIAHIYAEQAHGDVGLNRFQKFEVGANQIANMHFQTAPNGKTLNHLVNTVVEKINISGTVNAIRENKIGGNLIFISPTGMVLNSSGVINAGSLTVLANNQTFATAEAAYVAVHDPQGDGWYKPNRESSIEIYGQINTETGIDLRTETVTIKKAAGDGSPNPHLRTGVVFKDIVNIDDFKDIETYDVTDKRLILTQYKEDDNENSKVITVITNPITKEEVTSAGDGKINIRAQTSEGQSDYYGTFELTDGSIDAIGKLQMDVGKDITINSSSSIKANHINMYNNLDSIYNDGTIEGKSDVRIQAKGQDTTIQVGDTYCLVNRGTIKSTGGGMTLDVKNGISNYGTINASGEIKMTALNGVVNQGSIISQNSNVSFVIGREFFNVAKNDAYEFATYVPHNLDYLNNDIEVLIQAGGNVQISYTDKTTGTVGKNPNDTDTVTYAPIGIYNSSTIRSGTAISATGGEGTVDVNSGSGNIWLTSSYNITNYGTMEAGRQITLNARDFLHNYGLIQGVTYLDIKSIMGYVYNHGTDNDGNAMDPPGRIIATGGNIDLSSGQANLKIDNDTDGQKKEEYRKFTPIIIEGLVEATSDLNNKDNETNQGNINITAHLGDIYVNGGTIETIEGPSGEVESVAGNVSLNAAQNITIGFDTVKAWDDDPTTDKKDNREYYKPILDSNSVPSSPCQNPATISGSNISLTSGSNENNYILISNTKTGGNALPASNTLTASNAITINTNSMNIVGGTFNAGTLEAVLAENGTLNITGGTINAANVNSNTDMSINGGVIYTGTAQGRLSANNISMESGSVSGKDVTIAAAEQMQLNGGIITAQAEGAGKLTVTAGTNLVHDGATIAADNATFSAGNKIDLQSGSLTATGAAAFDVTSGTSGANSILESASGYNLSVGSLSLSANQGNIILNGANNVLQGVTLANVGGNVEFINGNNTNTRALTISTAEETTVGGTIIVTNNGEGITVEGINATNNVNLTAGENITVAGDVNAANASFNAGQDFIHESGTITASGAVVTAGRDVKLNSGRMEASTSASLTAGSATSVEADHGDISERTEYALITPQVNASAVGAITLDSSANQLVNVNVTKVGGALALGSGNKNSNEALQVDIGQVVSGNLTINNYSLEGDNSANDIVVAGTLGADNITITNAEADINAGTDAVINANNISLQANSGAVNVDGNATITAAKTTANNATFVANALDINIAGGQITADTVTITSNGTADNSGFTMNGGTITANTANITATKAINQTAGSIVATTTVASAGTDLSLASNANKLQNITVKANNGSASIVSGNDAGVALKVQTDGTVGGSLSIQSTSDILSEGTISVAGDVTMTAGDKVTINSGIVNANKLTANAADLSVNGGTINVHTLAASKGLNIANDTQNTAVTNITANSITVGGSIGITGGNVVTTSVAAGEALNITGGSVSSDSLLSLSGVTGVTIGIQAAISTGGDLTLAASGGGVTNNSELNISGSVTLSGKGNVTNKASITAEDMSMESTTGAVTNSGALNATSGSVTLTGQTDVTNSANITAAQDVTMTATTRYVNNSKVVKANGGNINLTGGTNINLQDGYGLEASDTINLTTDNMQITGGTIKANTLAASGSLDITGGSVGSTGALTISGAKGVTIDSAATITTGNNLTIASIGGAVENNRILNITTGSVTLSGSGDVTNNVNITATQDIILQSTTGAITNYGILSGGQDVAISSTSGNIDNQGKITAGRDLSLNSTSGAIENSAAIEATNGIVELSGSGITNNSAINAAGSVVLSGTNSIANDGSITAGKGIEFTSTAGTISNGGGLTAKGGSVDLRGNKDITNDGRIQANRNVSIISGDGKVTNNAKLAAGVDFGATVQAVALFSVRALAEDSGSVKISGKGDVANAAGATISAKDSVVVTSEGGTVNNSSAITADDGSVEITGNRGVTNNENATITAGNNVGMTADTGIINNSGTITADNNVSMIVTAGTITNSSSVTATSGSVTMSGSGTVTNDNAEAIISAGGSVSMTSNAGAIENSSAVAADTGSVTMTGQAGVTNDNANASISAGGSVSMTSNAGAVENSKAITASNGSVTMTGQTGVSNDNANASINAGGSVSMTSNAGAVDNSSTVTTTGGSVTISGSSGVDNSANITANDNISMSSGAGSVINSSDVKADTGSVEISGNGGVTNTANITANQNVNLSANAGAISNAGSVTAVTGNIGLNSNNGITSTAEGSSLNVNSLNGSISAATTYGEVNISEIIAGGNATASSQNGSVSIGTVAGNDVVLTGGSDVTIGTVTGSDVVLTGGSDVTIGKVTGSNVAITGGSDSDVKVDNITVDNSLKLQGDNITATNVNRSENASGALNVDVSGAGSTDSTAQGDVNLKIEGDVVFNNLNVTDAKIETTGTLHSSKLHVDGKAQITSSNTTVNVYGKDVTPDPNDRNAIQDNGDGVPPLTIDSNGVKSDGLRVNYPVQLSGKLVDYDPYDTYLEHYGDVADIFGRTDLIIAAESPSGDFAQGGVVILKLDAEGLRIEEQKKEE